MKALFGFVLALALGACGNDGGADDTKNPDGSERCASNSDCSDDFVCLVLGNVAACTPICTGDADACGASAQCGGVGVMDVDVCQPEPEEDPSENPPEPEEQPRIPCKSDAECKEFDASAICAEFQGQRDCTIPCTTESQCDMSSLGGVTMDFLTCIADEGNTSRKACLPDEDCFANPMTCISGFPGGFPDDGGDFEF